MKKYKAEIALSCGNSLGEGCLWSSGEQRLYWVDVVAKRIHFFHPESGESGSWQTPAMPTALGCRESGGLIVSLADGVYLCEPETKEKLVLFAKPEPDPAIRLNDSKVDPFGNYWVGSMQNNIDANGNEIPIRGKAGSLFCIRPDGTVKRLEHHIGVSNTLAWTADHRYFYFTDSLESSIYRYQYDPEKIEIRYRIVFNKTPEYAVPDGSCLDSEGYLWNARWDGGAVLRIAPNGEIDAIVELPVAKATCVAFGGKDLSTLYITTAQSEGEGSASGALFQLQAGVKGVEASLFKG